MFQLSLWNHTMIIKTIQVKLVNSFFEHFEEVLFISLCNHMLKVEDGTYYLGKFVLKTCVFSFFYNRKLNTISLSPNEVIDRKTTYQYVTYPIAEFFDNFKLNISTYMETK